MDSLTKRLRTRRKFRLGDVIKSPHLGVCELIIDMHMKNGEMTYGMMYIEGPVDGMHSAVRCTYRYMESLQYKILYNIFDRRTN